MAQDIGRHFGRLGSWKRLEEWAILLNPLHPFALFWSLRALPLCPIHCGFLRGANGLADGRAEAVLRRPSIGDHQEGKQICSF